ncbi:MAG: hypothetical protein KJ057_17620 [Phycisphaerae bacterium]|nr:MAG: hypothetical protein EDS66_17165 [Planctomycetota bacterium]MBE7457971.1 hypothetical protein [Planctomycetia bacterium]MCL4720285.1 hypothetical protein [Phycisphaerae bacterium]NUQ10668.1 hypothetical protein [Phycisphaerae bacterium]
MSWGIRSGLQGRVRRTGVIAVAVAAAGGTGATMSAMAASHTVTFNDLAFFSSYLPSQSFNSITVDVDVYPVNLTVGNSCNPNAAGAATVVSQSFQPCTNGPQPNNKRMIIDQVLLDFDISDYVAQIGGPVRRIKFRYKPVAGNVQLVVNGNCFVQPTFGAINGSGFGFSVNDNGCAVTIKAAPGTAIMQFSLGGDVLFIDNVRASD